MFIDSDNLDFESKLEWLCLFLQHEQKDFEGINSLKDWEARMQIGAIPEEQISYAFERLVDLTAADYEVYIMLNFSNP